MRAGTRYWTAFVVGALGAIAGMAWITVHALALERAEASARAGSAHANRIADAVWRMDAWLNAQLAPEAARPYFHYRAFHGEQRAWTRGLGAIAPGEVVTPSPLLAFRSALFPLHFQVQSDGTMTSPQAPAGNERDLAEGSLGVQAEVELSGTRLAALQRAVGFADLGARLGQAALLPMNCVSPGAAIAGEDRAVQSRYRQSVDAKNPVMQQASWNALASIDVSPGPLLPIWIDASDGARLLYARRVDVGGGTVFQGFEADWPTLRDALLEQVADLFPAGGVGLVRQDRPDESHRARLLASVPARLDVPDPEVPQPAWSPTRTVLASAWAAVLAAIVAIGATLGAALSFGQKRARFASAVTHELRSPLTTFRMYSEMLAEGMVTDPDRRAEYVRTLQRESDRLARLVENVLAYARIEDGRQHLRRERVTVAELIARVRGVLERRLADGGFTLVVGALPDAAVDVDVEAIEQVLFGLCDNACKYGAQTDGPRRVELDVRHTGGSVELGLRDHGPGIPAEHRRAVFKAFERGARPDSESVVPGIGLGLALARGLARDLGGELTLDPTVGDGARFVLRLPAAT